VEVLGKGAVNGKSSTIKIMNMTGTILQPAKQIDLSHFPKGVYFLVIRTPDKNQIEKLILQ